MATKDESMQTRVAKVKAAVCSTTTCSDGTVVMLEELLLSKDSLLARKENVRGKVQASTRRRAGTAATDQVQQLADVLAPREKYVLATDIANVTLQNLAEALKSSTAATARLATHSKSPPTDHVRKPAKSRERHARSASVAKKPLVERSVSQVTNSLQERVPRRSSSYSSVVTSTSDAGLVAMAECARTAFAYLGTQEAKKVLGKDSKELQLENGMLALISKLVGLGLEGLAAKELRSLKKRLDRYLGYSLAPESVTTKLRGNITEAPASATKDSLASLLEFGSIEPLSPVLPLVVNLQIYTLKVIAKLNRPRVVEATWNYLKPSNPSSPANLIYSTASTSNNPAKAARQLELLSQTILTLCPNISSSHDDRPLQPAADTTLLLQHLAFKTHHSWWKLVNHQGKFAKEVLEPFAKCLVTFARRSELSPGKKYSLASSLLADLTRESHTREPIGGSLATISKTLGLLAQAAGRSDEAHKWSEATGSSLPSITADVKHVIRLVQTATQLLDAFSKREIVTGLENSISNGLSALEGCLNGSCLDLDALYAETNAMRRVATRLIISGPPEIANGDIPILAEERLVKIIASCVHFASKIVQMRIPNDEETQPARHNHRMSMIWKCTKSMVDSVLVCCKRIASSPDWWEDLDVMIQDCVLVLRELERAKSDSICDGHDREFIDSLMVRLSNGYWTMHLLLRKATPKNQIFLTAIHRSIDLVLSRPCNVQETAHLKMKLEQLGDALEGSNDGKGSCKAYEQCIRTYLHSEMISTLSFLAAKDCPEHIFADDGPQNTFARVLKSHHRSFIKFGPLSQAKLAVFDDSEIQSDVRGLLLEFQLCLYLRSLSRNRHWNKDLNSTVAALVDRLLNLYDPQAYPIRRLRLHTMLLQLANNHQNVLPSSLLSTVLAPANVGIATKSKDAALARYEAHLRALLDLKISMQQQPIDSTFGLQKSLSFWESLVGSSPCWETLVNCIENIEDWIKDIQACVEYANAKGGEYLALPMLNLLVKIGELKGHADATQLVTDLCALSLQLLRLGYTGKAGVPLTRCELLFEQRAVSTEARLRWHVAYAECLAKVGNISKCISIMSAAHALARGDQAFMDLAKPSTTVSGRVRFNRVLADASYVQSLVATATGSYKDATKFARQCVTLNRRIWAALESKASVKKSTAVDEDQSDGDSSSRPNLDFLSSICNDKGSPVVVSVTHAALDGPEFWSLVPALYRGMMQHSQILADQGLLQEAMYVAEQAEKVASATASPTFLTDNASWRADCWAQSGRPDKAQQILDSLSSFQNRKCLSVAGYHSAVARIHHWNGEYEEEQRSYGALEQLISDLTCPTFLKALDTFHPEVEALADKMSAMTVSQVKSRPTRAKTTARVRKPISQPATRAKPPIANKNRPQTRARGVVKPKLPTNSEDDVPGDADTSNAAAQCFTLRAFRAGILCRSVIASLLQDDIRMALDIVRKIETQYGTMRHDPLHSWVMSKVMIAQSFKQIVENFAVNTLPESTIAFPALGTQEQSSSDSLPAKRTTSASSATAKPNRSKQKPAQEFTDVLRSTRDSLAEAHATITTQRSNHLFQQVSIALSNVTVLLSAVSGKELCGSLHPLYAAYMSEIPKFNALKLAQTFIEVEREQISREECSTWPVMSSSDSSFTPLLNFQQDYVNIIPDTWTAVSLALNDNLDELYITRFESGTSPFVLRLPLTRHASRDMDEEEFTFEDGKRDFEEIIDLSDFSTRTAKDMTSREARQQWWTEREALDTRLHELLLNMENIWLGGFKGIFSQHEKHPSLLARFRKSLDNILNQHLPSRRRKTQQKKPMLDARILELFVGLGDATNESLDLDDALMDLIYFVVDILHFNGEHNAYDEIDFDSMVVETYDALRAYHSACQPTMEVSRHVILILDNNLHKFPWESMPCLETLSISRLPSLAALRDRILAAKRTAGEDKQFGHHVRTTAGGTSILNPSGDLSHTLKTLQPRLDALHGPWTNIVNRTPSEKEFEDSLSQKDLVLYFGHGSGAQFVRSKSVRRLYPGPQDEHEMTFGCATTFLFGCSSVHLTENGIYEPSGMLASYLAAGAPAVVGMLWDVTDKDCDRFAVRAGELWGLWPELEAESAPTVPPKTPAKREKGKGRVAQLVQEVEDSKEQEGGKKHQKSSSLHNRASATADQRNILGLDQCIRDARKACVLRYLNGAAAVVYGIPVYLG